VLKEIDAEAVLENCRALIEQIKAGLSAEKTFVNASSACALPVARRLERSWFVGWRRPDCLAGHIRWGIGAGRRG
jgi:hypothetical protein